MQDLYFDVLQYDRLKKAIMNPLELQNFQNIFGNLNKDKLNINEIKLQMTRKIIKLFNSFILKVLNKNKMHKYYNKNRYCHTIYSIIVIIRVYDEQAAQYCKNF